jgi:trehalose 6-phosphate synthase/phosphatase
MDSFSEPYTRMGDDISLDEVRAQVLALEADHRAAGIPLSGRVLHVCHYLPVQMTLNTAPGVLSPPATPPMTPSDAPMTPPPESKPDPDTNAVWTLVPRYGHAAMISGIRSLAATHEQLIVGWTGDVQSSISSSSSFSGEPTTLSPSSISPAHKAALVDALAAYQPKESDPDDEKKTQYVPVWLDDAVAHGHYDGYCKQTLWPLFHYLLWQDIASEVLLFFFL